MNESLIRQELIDNIIDKLTVEMLYFELIMYLLIAFLIGMFITVGIYYLNKKKFISDYRRHYLDLSDADKLLVRDLLLDQKDNYTKQLKHIPMHVLKRDINFTMKVFYLLGKKYEQE